MSEKKALYGQLGAHNWFILIMSKNPYEILQLEEDATYDEIKERYRHLTRNLHPDKQPLENYQASKQHF